MVGLFVLLTHLLLNPCLAWTEPVKLLPDAILYPGEKPGHIIVVDKAEQQVHLYHQDGKGNVTLVRVMDSSTGGKLGDKMVEGDKKTPNGFYLFNEKFLDAELAPRYGIMAYPTDYPNFWDKKLGRGGYGIWIHGVNEPMADYKSEGCVWLENAELVNLESLIQLYDTPLLTYETLALAPASDLAKQGEGVHRFIESWRQAWVNKDHQGYQVKYDKNFVNSDRRSFKAWMEHKVNVGKRYELIEVGIKDLRIYRHRDVIVALFEQNYKGDKHFSSDGLKRLYLKKNGDSYLIVAEEFRQKPDTTTRKWLTAEQKRKALETPSLTSIAANKALAEGQRTTAATDQTTVLTASAGQARTSTSKSNFPVIIGPLATPENPKTSSRFIREIVKAQWQPQAQAVGAALARSLITLEVRAETKALALAQARATSRADETEAAAKAEATAKTEAAAKAEVAAKSGAETKIEVQTEGQIQEAPMFIELVKTWARAWSRRDVGAYFAFYVPDFHYQPKDMDMNQFIQYRSDLMVKAKSIRVKVSDFKVSREDEDVKVTFVQHYRSGEVGDLGYKTLTFVNTSDGWKIANETWRSF